MTGPMPKLSEQITVRLTPELRSSIDEIEQRHRIGAGEFVRGLVEAGVALYRSQGWFSFPVQVLPDEGFGPDRPAAPGPARRTGSESRRRRP